MDVEWEEKGDEKRIRLVRNLVKHCRTFLCIFQDWLDGFGHAENLSLKIAWKN